MSHFKCQPPRDAQYTISTTKSGKDVLNDPKLNKGTAFTAAERQSLGLHGLLPTAVETMAQQVAKHYAQYTAFQTDLERNIYLHALYNNNEMLFYQLLSEHLEEMLPIIYTPTVGTAVQKFSAQFRRERGIYISYHERENMRAILEQQLSERDAHTCIVTDGSAVLGIGDQGIGGMAIAIGKQIVYALCGGLNPLNIIPIQLDCGTDNETLLADPHYLGWRHRRISEDEYQAFIEAFVTTINDIVPGIFIHWEDVAREHAVQILNQYDRQVCTFNDDIQGTGAVTMACLLSAIKKTGSSLAEQRIVIHGAGAAALGIAQHIAQAMQMQGIPVQQSSQQFYLLNRRGLLTQSMSGLNELQLQFAQADAAVADWPEAARKDLLGVVQQVKPTILIGCSTQAGAFSEAVVRTMADGVAQPIILPLSNPSQCSEVNPEDAIRWSDGRALVATGSPFAPVQYAGSEYTISQCNNALIYPAIGLGVTVARASRVSFEMLQAASEALSELMQNNANGNQLLPQLTAYPDASMQVARAVAKQAFKEGVSAYDEWTDLEDALQAVFWKPGYRPIQND
jgi:malate dehydrogenase (oxaloacetate-decarboxylating)